MEVGSGGGALEGGSGQRDGRGIVVGQVAESLCAHCHVVRYAETEGTWWLEVQSTTRGVLIFCQVLGVWVAYFSWPAHAQQAGILRHCGWRRQIEFLDDTRVR